MPFSHGSEVIGNVSIRFFVELVFLISYLNIWVQ